MGTPLALTVGTLIWVEVASWVGGGAPRARAYGLFSLRLLGRLAAGGGGRTEKASPLVAALRAGEAPEAREGAAEVKREELGLKSESNPCEAVEGARDAAGAEKK